MRRDSAHFRIMFSSQGIHSALGIAHAITLLFRTDMDRTTSVILFVFL